MKLVDLASRLGLELGGAPAAAGAELSGLAPVERAGPRDLTYVAERRHEAALASSRAGAVVCSDELARAAPVPCLVSAEPAADFARATRLLYARTRPAPGVHPTASVAGTARIGAGASVGPYAVVGAGAEVGARAEIHAHVVLYPDVRIGEETVVYAGAVLREGTRVGARCVLQPNVVLGGDGFGFARARSGAYEKIEQMGVVEIGDDVELGAATTVDRATFDATTVGRGTKIDNLVQIGHNSSVGEETILCAQVGLAGSTRVGRGVTLAGQVGVAGHLEVGDNAVATAQTGIPSSVAPGAVVSGYPAIDNRSWLKSSAAFGRLPELARTVRRLEARLAALEARLEEKE